MNKILIAGIIGMVISTLIMFIGGFTLKPLAFIPWLMVIGGCFGLLTSLIVVIISQPVISKREVDK